ncbi:F-box protein CPR1-like [Corylus avellana]|uniref:F-box protein CPR1-like n=1 Tax=Corylus avellana TaxID=13451 RepID=UPI00286B41C3|nr:F-box protein CPR1-like [Corylus avellana]
MTPLPKDIITEILFRLQVKPLLRFQCVSKPLFALINGPYFINMHLRRSIENNRERTLIAEETPYSNMPRDFCGPHFYALNFSDIPNISDDDLDWAPPVKIFQPFSLPTKIKLDTAIIGCCNGLVCLHTSLCSGLYRNINPIDPSETVIWNPLIRKYKKLPFKPVENSDNYELELAFGYDHVNDDYKVLRILKYRNHPQVLRKVDHVYSLRTHSWRIVEDQWLYKELGSFIFSGPVSSNGALHWVVRVEGRSLSTIVAFDLATEKFRVHALPCPLLQSNNICLDVLRGWLCVCSDYDCRFTRVWVMKEYGVVSSWTPLDTLGETPIYCKPLVFSKDGKEVFMKESFRRCFWDDIKDNTLSSRLKYFKKYTLLVGSLLLLDGDSDH